MPRVDSFIHLPGRNRLDNGALERYEPDLVYDCLSDSGFWHHNSHISPLFRGLQLFSLRAPPLVQATVDPRFLLRCNGGADFKHSGLRRDQGSDQQADFYRVFSPVRLRVGHLDHWSLPVSTGPRTCVPHEVCNFRHRGKPQQGALRTEAQSDQYLLDNTLAGHCPGAYQLHHTLTRHLREG